MLLVSVPTQHTHSTHALFISVPIQHIRLLAHTPHLSANFPHAPPLSAIWPPSGHTQHTQSNCTPTLLLSVPTQHIRLHADTPHRSAVLLTSAPTLKTRTPHISTKQSVAPAQTVRPHAQYQTIRIGGIGS
eukprot:162068-Rhodomonas_salina.1